MTRTQPKPNEATPHAAEIVREYGPFAGTERIGGVTHDGRYVWAAAGAGIDFSTVPVFGSILSMRASAI